MSRFLPLPSILKFRAARGSVLVLCLAAFLTLLPSAVGQTFTLTMAPFNFDAIDPGGTDSAPLTVNGSDATVDLACQATSQQSSGTAPSCSVSPTTVVAPGSATVTVNAATATPGLYLITVIGTGPSPTSPQQQSQYLTVLSVTAQYTITVQAAISPSTVAAGLTGVGTISVNPLNDYSGTVTLACGSISPLVVTYPPYCTFSPNPVTVVQTPVTSTITITSTGVASLPPVPGGARNQSHSSPRRYAFWLPLPMLALALGAAAGGKRSRKAWILFWFFVLCGSALLMPACATVTTTPESANQASGTTPNNTYTFTLTGVDTNGNPASNTGSSSSAPTVSLTVN
jgi:hypothetical protein